MAESKATAPHFYLQAEIDMTLAVDGRKRLKEMAKEGEAVPTFNDMVVKACALALQETPRANGAYRLTRALGDAGISFRGISAGATTSQVTRGVVSWRCNA